MDEIHMRIAVYGASGFTGRLVVAELARQGIETVLVGRDIERLREAAKLADATAAETRLADLAEPTALARAFEDCDAVVNCVAPFVEYGEPVVRAAMAAGCHYVDTTGEQLYLARIFDAYAKDAERAGVTLVPAMTDDGLPGDLIAHLTAARIGDVAEITIADLRLPGGASRGTARSALANESAFVDGALTYQDGRWRAGVPTRRGSIVPPGHADEVAVTKLALPGVVTVPRHVPARYVEGVIRAEVGAVFTSITAELVDAMPDGPSENDRRARRWLMMAEAVGHDGRRARGAVWGTDTYGTTAVVAVEGARRLVADGAAPGVLAPAQAFDPADFLDALAPRGVRWTVQA
jgi:short subunit dehydrogenase-like uncharacterized protein